MELTYAADLDQQDSAVHEAADVRGQVRVRAALTVYRDQQYQTWPGQSWAVRGTPSEVLAVRAAMKALFEALERRPATQVVQVLELA